MYSAVYDSKSYNIGQLSKFITFIDTFENEDTFTVVDDLLMNTKGFFEILDFNRNKIENKITNHHFYYQEYTEETVLLDNKIDVTQEERLCMQIWSLIQISLSKNYSKWCEGKYVNSKMFINPQESDYFTHKQLIIENLDLQQEFKEFIQSCETHGWSMKEAEIYVKSNKIEI